MMGIFKPRPVIQLLLALLGMILFLFVYEFMRGLVSSGSPLALESNIKPILLTAAFPAVVLLYMRILAGKADEQLNIAAVAFESQNAMTITDARNTILRVNRAFVECTGYLAEEVIGKNPRILSSGRHDAGFYAAMWETINRTGGWEGEVWNRRKNGEIYPEHLSITAVKDRDGIVTNYVASFSDISRRKMAEEEIQNLAFYDPLTSLPNRRLLLNRLKKALASSARSGVEGALLFIDLDNFKTLNDTLGHDKGDLLLQQVAQRLMSCVREGDTVAKFGGDEFVVMLGDLGRYDFEAAEGAEAVGEKILAALNQPYHLAAHEYRGSTSIGVTLFKGHQQQIDELLKQADIAMYQAKKDGRNILRFFDPDMQETINARAALENELRIALENRQFHLYYQIQVDSSHRPLGAEVLIRWIHPERGLISPDQFIPLAEETGVMLPIGQWVLESACAQLKAWQQDALTRELVLAVNVSARQFRQADFVALVQAAVRHHAINPMLLKLELTESMLLENIEDTVATMKTLKRIGIKFSLDDFGTGYSSLQYLKRLPLDQLKIDQSFVRDITFDSSDRAIVRTIIVMAHSLNLDVIAEGGETEEQRQLLLNKGCTHYQGYLFSKPVPIEQFEAQLRRVQTL
jgi:diguanylate cyclase (GGDEF)-like protein/PAS domain S-box-containing protein